MAFSSTSPEDFQHALRALRQMPNTAGLSSNTLQLIAAHSQVSRHTAGEAIWHRGSPGNFFAIICNGLVEISRHSTNENETTLGIFGPSDGIGMIALFQSGVFPGTAKVLTSEATVLRCNLKPDLRQPVGEEIHQWIREMILNHEQILRDKIDLLNGHTSEVRLIELLLQFSNRFGANDPLGRTYVPIYLTRAQISRLINVRIETVIRMMSRWGKLGWVTWTQEGMIIANRQALISMSHCSEAASQPHYEFGARKSLRSLSLIQEMD